MIYFYYKFNHYYAGFFQLFFVAFDHLLQPNLFGLVLVLQHVPYTNVFENQEILNRDNDLTPFCADKNRRFLQRWLRLDVSSASHRTSLSSLASDREGHLFIKSVNRLL